MNVVSCARAVEYVWAGTLFAMGCSGHGTSSSNTPDTGGFSTSSTGGSAGTGGSVTSGGVADDLGAGGSRAGVLAAGGSTMGVLAAGGATGSGAAGSPGAGGATGGPSGAGGSATIGDAGGDSPMPAGFWPSGTDGLSRTFADGFGTWRGRPVTSNWINVHWLHWDWLTEPGLYSTLNGTDPVKVWDLYAGWSGVMVLSASMAGSSEDTDYDARMRECANGNFDGYWRTFAQNATAAGRTGANTVVSPAHEFNGTWFKWNPGNVGLDVWKSCWRHVYAAIHQQSSLRVVWVLSATTNTVKGGDFSVNTAWDAYPGDDYVDIVGINRYDFKNLGSATSSNWKDTCGNTQDICYVAKYAREHGKPIGIPEWSMDRGQYGYPDRPEFVQMMFDFFKDNADILAFENNFNNSGSGEWNYYPESSVNEKSAERYRALWKQ